MAFSTINKSSSFMNPKIYTGTGSSNALTGIGFQPDLVWAKARANGSSTNNHQLVDVIRGVEKVLSSDRDVGTQNEPQSITAFGADGFTLGTSNVCNQSGIDGVSWNWKANGAGSANTDGSISSTVSANTTSGFSIVKYTGTGSVGTIGHGLGAVPKMLIFKTLSSNDWYVHHTATGVNGRLILNGTNASADNTAFLNQVLPTSTLITIGTAGQVNASGEDFICYAFADVAGFSKMGSYIGNASSTGDGTFIYTGFAPKFIMVKNSSTLKNWHTFDTARDGLGMINHDIKPNLVSSGASATGVYWFDYLSNGFKVRMPTSNADYSDINASGSTYIYMAFGQPIISNSGVCATAR